MRQAGSVWKLLFDKNCNQREIKAESRQGTCGSVFIDLSMSANSENAFLVGQFTQEQLQMAPSIHSQTVREIWTFAILKISI